MSASAKFWDRTALKYSQQPVPDQSIYEQKLMISRKYFSAESQLLEIGCGTGSTAIAHAPYVKSIHAVDISSVMLDIAQQKANASNLKNITFQQTPVDELSPGHQYDVILALSLLHLVDDKDTLINSIYQWLKPGGTFISNTACLGDSMGYFKLIGPIGKALGFLPTLKVFKANELENSMVNAGFKIDFAWQPKGISRFIVCQKVET